MRTHTRNLRASTGSCCPRLPEAQVSRLTLSCSASRSGGRCGKWGGPVRRWHGRWVSDGGSSTGSVFERGALLALPELPVPPLAGGDHLSPRVAVTGRLCSPTHGDSVQACPVGSRPLGMTSVHLYPLRGLVPQAQSWVVSAWPESTVGSPHRVSGRRAPRPRSELRFSFLSPANPRSPSSARVSRVRLSCGAPHSAAQTSRRE